MAQAHVLNFIAACERIEDAILIEWEEVYPAPVRMAVGFNLAHQTEDA
jgi:hypothetical protein